MIEDTPYIPDPAGRRELLEVLSRAFRDNPMNVEIHGSSPSRRIRANRAGLRALVLDGGRGTETRVIKHNGKILGGFIATPPGLDALPAPSFRRQIGCFIHQGARAMDQWGRVSLLLGELRPVLDHWYLAILGVEPSMQGRGFGGKLLDALSELAEMRPAPVYLESDRESSARFYRGHGFQDRDEVSILGVRCWCLGRGFADESGDLCDPVRQA